MLVYLSNNRKEISKIYANISTQSIGIIKEGFYFGRASSDKFLEKLRTGETIKTKNNLAILQDLLRPSLILFLVLYSIR